MLRKQSKLHLTRNYTCADSCQSSFLRFDIYKQPFGLLLPDRQSTYRTFAGAMLSLFTIVVVLSFGTFKF